MRSEKIQYANEEIRIEANTISIQLKIKSISEEKE